MIPLGSGGGGALARREGRLPPGDVVSMAAVPEDRLARTVPYLEPQARAVGARLCRPVSEHPGDLDDLAGAVRGLVGRGGDLHIGRGATPALLALAGLSRRRRAEPGRWESPVGAFWVPVARWSASNAEPAGGAAAGTADTRPRHGARPVRRRAGVGDGTGGGRATGSRDGSPPGTVLVRPHRHRPGHGEHCRQGGRTPDDPPSSAQALPAVDDTGQELVAAAGDRLAQVIPWHPASPPSRCSAHMRRGVRPDPRCRCVLTLAMEIPRAPATSLSLRPAT